MTQVRSAIGAKPKHRGTLRALGLRRPGRQNELPDRPEIRGMLAKVAHLVRVEEVGPALDAGGAPAGSGAGAPGRAGSTAEGGAGGSSSPAAEPTRARRTRRAPIEQGEG